jgi:penicillin amidase
LTARRREALVRDLCRPVSTLDAVAVRAYRHGVALLLAVAIPVLLYAVDVATGFGAHAATRGRIVEPQLHAPVVITRDARDVPHIVASSSHDLFFAQGFAEGSDRLFQMELTRRYATGTLAEVLGPRALGIDEEQRYYDVRDVAQREWQALRPSDRAALSAFSDGVNAAMQSQPLPIEFRLLIYRPRPWEPQDSLAVSLAVSIALADSWRDVLARDDVWRRYGPSAYGSYFPLSDARYDVSLAGDATPSAHRNAGDGAASRVAALRVPVPRRAGSNAWAAGSARTMSGRALLANDPHLDLTIPGLWYLVDLKAPGIHVAGVSIPGAPGVLLGHNERIAWGATNADASAMSLFRMARASPRAWAREVFHVRFGPDVAHPYYRTAREFAVPDPYEPGRTVLVRWAPFYERSSPVSTFLSLDRAASVRETLHVLAGYRSTAENFVIAGTRGEIAYHMAGSVPLDPVWSRYLHPARDLARTYDAIPFALLPAVLASRDATIVNANNKTYGSGYPYRLSATFDPPYRAYRIAQLLHERDRYNAGYFARMQLDTLSPVDAEFARLVHAHLAHDASDPSAPAVMRALAGWDGSFAPGSQAATVEHALRARLEANAPSFYAVLESLRNADVSQDAEADLQAASYGTAAAPPPWGHAGAVPVEHPLAPLRFGFLNGATLPGNGDEYTIRLQEPGFSQSFRAVWDVGNWDAGGIAIPSGESGEPGSGHYRDLTGDWIAGRLRPLPFSAHAVASATRARLILTP